MDAHQQIENNMFNCMFGGKGCHGYSNSNRRQSIKPINQVWTYYGNFIFKTRLTSESINGVIVME